MNTHPYFIEIANGDSYIFEAPAIFGDIDSVHDESGNTPLLVATKNGQEKIMKLLIKKHGADINAENEDGETPLSYAAENGRKNLVHILLRYTKKISTKNYKRAVAKAAKNGQTAIVELLLENGKIDSTAKDDYASEAITSAAGGGHTSVLEWLFARDDVDPSSKKTGGNLALLIAAHAGHINVVKLLLRRHDVDKKAQDANGRTALHLSVQAGHEDVVKFLVGRSDIEINASDTNGDTVLHMAAWNGQTAVVKVLLAKEETRVNAKNTSGRTALGMALGQGHADVIELLLERDDLELDGSGIFIDDFIRQDAINEYVSLADNQLANDYPGRNILSWTAENGRIEELSILLARDGTRANAKDGGGRTPLSRAAKNGHKLATKMLLKYNVDANLKDGDGQTPLLRAAANGHEQVVEMLLQHKADPNSTDNDGRAPLWWAVKNGHVASAKRLTPLDTSTLLLLLHAREHAAMEFLLRFEPRLDQKDRQGRTALHLAAEWDDLDIARTILLLGGNIDSRDNRNMTPLEIAMKKRHIKIIEELLKHNVCTEGITIKEWRDAYEKQKEDIFLLFEAPGGEKYIDFPQAIPSLQELYQTSPDRKSHLYVANRSKWPKMVIQTLPEATLVMNNLQVAERIDADILDISLSFQLSVNCDIDRQLSSIYDNTASRIMWRAIRPMNSRSPWTSILYFSTLSHGWIPDDGTDLFYQFVTRIKAQWVKLCEIFEEILSDKRLDQFRSKGKGSEITDSLAKDAQTLANLRIDLAGLTSDAEKFTNRYCEHFNANNTPQALQQLIKDDLEIGIKKRLEDLDQTVRDLLQIEFAWITIHETRVSTKLGQNVMLLTYVSIFYLPLGFCAALWAIPNITDNNTRTPFIVTATMVSVVTLLVTFNMEKITSIIQQGYQYGRDNITSKWKEMKGKRYPGLP